MPPDPPSIEGPSGLRQIYPPVTLKYPLMQKLTETPATTTTVLEPRSLCTNQEREKLKDVQKRQARYYNVHAKYQPPPGLSLETVIGV